MLTKSEDAKKRDRVIGEVEQARDFSLSTDQARLRDSKALFGAKTDARNYEAQRGKEITTEALLNKLKPLVSNVRGFPHPRHADKACFGVLIGGNQYWHIGTIEHPVCPEWNVYRTEKEMFPNTSPHKLYTSDGAEVEYFTPEVPFMVERESAVYVAKCGWRTLLAKFIKNGLLSLELAEKTFGVGDRASWAFLLKEMSVDKRDSPVAIF